MNFNKDRKTRNIWETRTIDDILNNPTYIGNLAQNRRRKVNYKSKKVIANPKEKWIIVENTHEPIIDLETFEMVQNIYEKNKKSLLNNKLYDNYNYKEIVEEYLSMKKPNKLLLSNIIDKITIDENKNVDIYYKIKPIFDYEIAN